MRTGRSVKDFHSSALSADVTEKTLSYISISETRRWTTGANFSFVAFISILQSVMFALQDSFSPLSASTHSQICVNTICQLCYSIRTVALCQMTNQRSLLFLLSHPDFGTIGSLPLDQLNLVKKTTSLGWLFNKVKGRLWWLVALCVRVLCLYVYLNVFLFCAFCLRFLFLCTDVDVALCYPC